MIELNAIQITNISTMKDGGLKVTLETQEMTTEQKISLFDGFQKIERLQAARLEPKAPKSLSKRLMDKLYILWTKKKHEEGFEAFSNDYDLYRENVMKGYMDGIQIEIDRYS